VVAEEGRSSACLLEAGSRPYSQGRRNPWAWTGARRTRIPSVVAP